MDEAKLRPDTALAWQIIKDEPLAREFVLIGGTALAMHIGHRVSEDLDFAYVGSSKHLPRKQLRELRAALAARGLELHFQFNPLEEENFLESGLELANYQQDFIANGTVKISFVRFESPMDQLLQGVPANELRVATLNELFETKVFACSERSKTRDWLDLYILLTQHGYGMRQVYGVFDRLGRLPAFNSLQMRLRRCKVSASDEGYESLMDAPPDLETMRQFFIKELDQLERDLAEERHLVPPAPSSDQPSG